MLFSSSAYGQEQAVTQVRHNGERRLLKSGLKKHARESMQSNQIIVMDTSSSSAFQGSSLAFTVSRPDSLWVLTPN
jgi:hypothetical protein